MFCFTHKSTVCLKLSPSNARFELYNFFCIGHYLKTLIYKTPAQGIKNSPTVLNPVCAMAYLFFAQKETTCRGGHFYTLQPEREL